jgi:hypothetical protein
MCAYEPGSASVPAAEASLRITAYAVFVYHAGSLASSIFIPPRCAVEPLALI